MRKLLHADVMRIVEKKWPWILLILAHAALAASVLSDINKSPDKAFYFTKSISSDLFLVTISIGLILLLSVYGDEFKYMSMIGVIGRGVPREKFVLAKFLDVVILALQLSILSGLFVFVMAKCLCLHFTPGEIRYLWLMFVFAYVEIVTSVTLASIFFYLSESTALGIFAYITFELVIPLTLYFMTTLASVAKYHVDRFYISGMISAAYSDFIMEDVVEGTAFTLLGIGIYAGGALLTAALIFRKKELEF